MRTTTWDERVRLPSLPLMRGSESHRQWIGASEVELFSDASCGSLGERSSRAPRPWVACNGNCRTGGRNQHDNELNAAVTTVGGKAEQSFNPIHGDISTRLKRSTLTWFVLQLKPVTAGAIPSLPWILRLRRLP